MSRISSLSLSLAFVLFFVFLSLPCLSQGPAKRAHPHDRSISCLFALCLNFFFFSSLPSFSFFCSFRYYQHTTHHTYSPSLPPFLLPSPST